MKRYEHVPISEMEPYFSYWRDVLRAREFGQVFFVPISDSVYRAHQFADWMVGEFGEKVEILDLQANLLEGVEDIDLKIGAETEMAVVLASTSMFSPEGVGVLARLEKVYLSKGIGLLVFHDGFLSHMRSLSGMFQKMPSSFWQHSLIFPLHSEASIRGFVKVMCQDWSVSLSSSEVDELYEYCGGTIWLVTDVLRQRRFNKRISMQDAFEAETCAWKARQFWDSLPGAHRQWLVYGEAIGEDEKLIEKEFRDFGFFLYNGDLPLYMGKLITYEKQNSLVVEKGRVVWGGRDISGGFSGGEIRVMQLLLDNRGEVLTRDRLGEAFWRDGWEDQYSDQALDKIVSRLRKKIKKLVLPLRIVTKRGRGYESR